MVYSISSSVVALMVTIGRWRYDDDNDDNNDFDDNNDVDDDANNDHEESIEDD